MNKLYSLAFKRILSNLAAQQIKPANVEEILTSNNVKSVGDFVFHRLPRQQLRNFLKNPCPVQNVQLEQNKKIVQSSKSLRASFSIEEKKVCNKCPFKDQCSEYAKEGKPNSFNAVSDLLVYMQAMNNKSQLDGGNQMRVWASGYKFSDSFIACLEDLKQGGLETLEYEKIRLQYAEEKKNQQAYTQKLKGLDKVDILNPPTQNPMRQKKQKKMRQRNDSNSQVNKQSEKRERYQKNKEQFLQEQEENYPAKKSYRQENQKSNQFYRQSLAPRQGQQKRRQKYDRRQPRYDNQRRSRDQNNMQQDYQTYQKRNRRKQREYLFEQRSQRNPKQNTVHEHNRREKTVYSNGKQQKFVQPRDMTKKYRNTVYKDTGNSPFEQGRSGPRPRIKQQQSFYENRLDFDKKFDKAGKVYKNPQIFQTWNNDESFEPQHSKPYSKPVREDLSRRAGSSESTRFETPKPQRAPSAPTAEQKGRRVRK